ncbi:MAG: chemotaxis protein [Faecalibacterium sp.]
MGQAQRGAADKSLSSLHRATDILSALLAQEVRALNEQKKAARKESGTDAGTMKGLKEATAVLKDLAAVAKTLNDQGAEAENQSFGVVLLPMVGDSGEDEEGQKGE